MWSDSENLLRSLFTLIWIVLRLFWIVWISKFTFVELCTANDQLNVHYVCLYCNVYIYWQNDAIFRGSYCFPALNDWWRSWNLSSLYRSIGNKTCLSQLDYQLVWDLLNGHNTWFANKISGDKKWFL